MKKHLLKISVVTGLFAALAACGGGTDTASISFVEISPEQPRIGDVVTVRFKLLDSRGVPLAGQQVDFKLQSENKGVELKPATAASNRGSGIAETQVVANGRVNAIVVVATSGGRTVNSPPISFAGANAPSARQFTFQCGQVSGVASGGRHAIGAYDPARNLIAGVKLDCTAHTGDRNGDGIGGATVSFLSEAGAIGPSENALTDVVGNATVLYKTSLPLPAETTPGKFTWAPAVGALQTGDYVAPLWMTPWTWHEDPADLAVLPNNNEPRRNDPIRLRTNNTAYQLNPRDNLVTLIAVTAGEEAFDDANNNGRYDVGENYIDLTEPFVDSNDNGTWDDVDMALGNPAERYIDVNGDGKWSGKNDKYDTQTLIWVSERVLWTGVPAGEDGIAKPGSPATVRAVQPSFVNLICPASTSAQCSQAGALTRRTVTTVDPMTGAITTTMVDVAGPVGVQAYLADPWFNAIAQNSDDDGCRTLQDEMLPVTTSPGVINAGQKFLYPAGDFIRFAIRDKRDPQATPEEQIPKRVPAIGFSAPISCQFTASAKEGHIFLVNIGNIYGTIE